MSVTHLQKYKSKGIVAMLWRLFKQARNGEILGIVFCVQLGYKEHAMGMCGQYMQDPMMAIAVTNRLLHKLNIMADEHQDISFGSLASGF